MLDAAFGPFAFEMSEMRLLRDGAEIRLRPQARRVLRALVHHPLTDKGLELFINDWKKTGQRIV